MRKMALFGTVMALVLTLAVVVPVFGAPPPGLTLSHTPKDHKPVPPLAPGTTLTFSGSGTAFKVSNKSITEPATISLTAKVLKSNHGRAVLNFTAGGKLTVGSDTFTVVRGHGIINFRSDKMILHLVVKSSAGKMFHLILYGKITGKISSTSAFTVDFLMHQSKLAHMWFLKFTGATVTPS